MDVYEIVRQIARESKTSMGEIARYCGISTLQSLNRSLHGGISLKKFVNVVSACGYELHIMKDGKSVGRIK